MRAAISSVAAMTLLGVLGGALVGCGPPPPPSFRPPSPPTPQIPQPPTPNLPPGVPRPPSIPTPW